MTVPCECCPSGVTGCWEPVTPLICNLPPALAVDVPPAFTSAEAIATGAFIVDTPFNGFNGEAGAGLNYARIRTIGGCNTPATGVVVRASLSADRNRVYSTRLRNNHGSILTDGDGLGAFTLTLLDAALAPIASFPLVGLNGGGIQLNALPGGPYEAVRHVEFSAIRKQVGPPCSINIGWWDFALISRYAATVTYNCPPFVMSGRIEALTDTDLAGLTFPPGGLNQANGPHSITWTVPAGITGTVTTDNPGNFSTLTINNGTVMTVTGNQANTWAVQWDVDDLGAAVQSAFLMVCDGAPMWFDSAGNQVPPELLIDCPEGAP